MWTQGHEEGSALAASSHQVALWTTVRSAVAGQETQGAYGVRPRGRRSGPVRPQEQYIHLYQSLNSALAAGLP